METIAKNQWKDKKLSKAIVKAKELSVNHNYVTIVQSVDNARTENAEIWFYVELEEPFIRLFEKQVHLWENGKLVY